MSDDVKVVKKTAEPYEPAFRRRQSSQGKNIIIILAVVVVLATLAIKFFS